MASFIFNNAKLLLANGGIDWDGDTIKVLLTHTSNPSASDDYVDDLAAIEPAASGNYARKTLTCDAPALVGSVAKLDAADLAGASAWGSLTSSTNPITGLVVFKDLGGADSANPLIAFIDFADVTTNGGDLSITWNAEGILKIA